MLTIVEIPSFTVDVKRCWTDKELEEFTFWLAANPEAGDVIPGSGGCRKVRWSRPGMGKRGGSRVVYFNRLQNGEIWLLMIYAKAYRGNVPASILKQIRAEIENE